MAGETQPIKYGDLIRPCEATIKRDTTSIFTLTILRFSDITLPKDSPELLVPLGDLRLRVRLPNNRGKLPLVDMFTLPRRPGIVEVDFVSHLFGAQVGNAAMPTATQDTETEYYFGPRCVVIQEGHFEAQRAMMADLIAQSTQDSLTDPSLALKPAEFDFLTSCLLRYNSVMRYNSTVK